jgi:indole-3-glycerol phosphate synthase
MTTILQEILDHKKVEVADRRTKVSIHQLEQSPFFKRETISLKQSVADPNKSGIIAEIKRKSPSKGVIHPNVSVEEISVGYARAGASAFSILTDTKFFGGTNEDIITARKLNTCPILRKDFIIDEYQIVEARSIGADAILLIAAALSPSRLKQLRSFATSLQLEVLMEVHDEQELRDNIDSSPDLVGVNNRDLKSFKVDVQLSKSLAPMIPDSIIKVSESGIESPQLIIELASYGFKGFLIGQRFMENGKPEEAARAFIQELNTLRQTIRK